MPLVRINSKIVYFAHTPKCAGTAVERYLKDRFGPLAFWDPVFGQIELRDRWSATSPQHMPEQTRLRVLPDAFLDAVFSVVRHPCDRVASVFLFQRDIEGRIEAERTFGDWLVTVPSMLAENPFALDGHLRPMVQTVPDTAVVFRMEEGLDRLVSWLDVQADDTEGPRTIAPVNSFAARMIHQKREVPSITPTPQDLALIAEIYAEDFARFGYDVLGRR